MESIAKLNVVLQDVTNSQTMFVWTVTNVWDRTGNYGAKL